jgi:hypothetical protein
MSEHLSRVEITVRDVKGGQDRVTMLPRTLNVPVQTHLHKVKELHDRDCAAGWRKVQLPAALDCKYPRLRPTGAGSGSSRRRGGGGILRPASKAAMTSTRRSCSGR